MGGAPQYPDGHGVVTLVHAPLAALQVPASLLGLPVKADSVGTFRITVAGQPEKLVDGSQGIDFVLRNTETGEQTVYRSLFMGPPGGQPGGAR